MPDALATAAAEGPVLDQANESFPRWRALAWFTLFRMLLATGLILVFVAPPGVLWRGTTIPPLSVLVLLTYCALILLAGLLVYLRWPKKQQQVQIAVFVDIVAFTLLMHAGGGVASGLGLLLAIAVAAGSLLMEGRLSLLFTAFATLGVIAQQASVQLYLGAETQTMTHAGLLGVPFFTVPLLGHVLYRRESGGAVVVRDGQFPDPGASTSACIQPPPPAGTLDCNAVEPVACGNVASSLPAAPSPNVEYHGCGADRWSGCPPMSRPPRRCR